MKRFKKFLTTSRKKHIKKGLEIALGCLLGVLLGLTPVIVIKTTYDKGYRTGSTDMGLYCAKVIGDMRISK